MPLWITDAETEQLNREMDELGNKMVDAHILL
jgi:hypothetical protein